jgi:hypothetical protein
LEGATLNLTNNFITNPSATTGSVPAYALCAATIPTAGNLQPTVNASENKFNNNGLTNGGLIINNGIINADCNWWGSTAQQAISAQFANSGTIDFNPWLVNGTDSDVNTMGFQPVSGSCTGVPIQLSETHTNVSCNGGSTGSINLTVDNNVSAPYTYLWSNGATTQDITTGLAIGTYSVTVTDANLSTSTLSVAITQPDVLAVSVSSFTNSLCYGASNGTVTVSGTGGTAPYVFSKNGTSFSSAVLFSNLAPGSYTITIKDANNCTSTTSVTITEPALVVASGTQVNNTACFGNTLGSINLSVVGGSGSYTYLWSGPSSYTATTQDITGLAAGTYSVVITEANSCAITGTISYTITQPTAVTVVNAGIHDVYCVGTLDGSITTSVTGGTPNTTGLPYSFAWTGANGFTASTPNQLANLAPGTYNVTVTDANGCTGTLTNLVVSGTAGIVVNVTTLTHPSCNQGTDGAIDVTITGGGQGYGSYQWKKNGNNYATTQDITGLSAGTYQLTLVDGNYCAGISSEITVTDPALLTASVAAVSSSVCSGQNAVFTITGTHNQVVTYNINGGTNTTATIGSLGTATVTVTAPIATQTLNLVSVASSTPSCSNSVPGSASITILPLPAQVNAGADQTVCKGDQVTLSGSSASQNDAYGWDNSVTNAIAFPAINATNLPIATTYTLTVTGTNTCTKTDQVVVTVNPRPSIDNITLPAICSATSASTTPSNLGGVNNSDVVPAGTTYTWSAPTVTGVTGMSSGTAASSFTSGTLVNSTNAAITVVYTVTPTSGSCVGSTFTVSVSVSPKPSIANITLSAICSAGSTSTTPSNGGGINSSDIVPTGTTYTWSAPTVTGVTGMSSGTAASSFTSGTLVNSTNAAITVVYTVTPTSGVMHRINIYSICFC